MEADLLAPFCEACSISMTKDLGGILKKRIIVSLCFANIKALYLGLFQDQHMDWNGVQEYLLLDACTIHDWISLLHIVDFINEPPSRQIITELIASTLASIKISTQGKSLNPVESMQLCFAKAGIAPSWDVLCKTLILCNLSEIDHSVAAQVFLQDHQYPTPVIDTLVKALSSCKHTPEEYTQAFIFLFSQCCHVRTHVLQQAFETKQLQREKIKKNAQSIYHAHRKPSLTQLLDSKRSSSSSLEQDSFLQFCNTSRLASNASMLVKRTIYYLKLIDAADGIERLIGNTAAADTTIISKMHTIVTPDIQALKAFIKDIHHIGPPHPALRLFREKCIPGSCHWSTILRLYLAAYCKPASKELWRFAVTMAGGGLCASAETETTTQRFVSQTPIEIEHIIDLVLAEQSAV